MDYENMITLTSRSKKEIAERVGIKMQTFDNYLRKLVDAEIFKRIGRGEYKVNPNLFARGDWTDISRQRDEWMLTITYKANGTRQIEGKTIKANQETEGWLAIDVFLFTEHSPNTEVEFVHRTSGEHNERTDR